MMTTSTKRLLAAFLMVGGSVCAGPAIAQNEAEPVEAVDLFDAEAGAAKAPEVKVGARGVSITATDIDITMVLRILSMQSKRNIIASRNVSGTVSATLTDVDFYEALDAILQPNGFGYQEKGNFIYVKTLEEIQAEEDANRVKVHKLVRLNYLSAADASAYVSPLLSGDGSISVSPEVSAGFQPSIGDGGANESAHPETLVIVDYEENVEAIVGLLTELDIQPEQVQIEATILQIGLTERTALGIDFSVYGDIGIDDITSPLGVVDDLISGAGAGGTPIDSGQGVSTSAGNTLAGQSGVKIGFLGSDASLFIRALDSVNDTSVLASPKALVLNRNKVELLVGQRLGYLSTTVTETSETQTVEFLDVGVQLTARPFISEDERVRMELRASLSDGNTDRVVDGNVIPLETTQEVITNVIMRNGQTVVLGGLFKEDTGSNISQLPGIGHVPVVGLLGKGQDDSVERSEVVFLVKPTIMKDETLNAIGEEMYGRAIDSQVGARKGLLPWSRTKMTAAHMAKARKFMDEGNEKKALWHTNLALHLDPTMVDAMRLKQDLTGESYFYHNRSNIDTVIDSVINAEADAIAPAEEVEEVEVLDDAMGAAEETVETAVDATASAEIEAFADEVTEEPVSSVEADAEAAAIEAALAEMEAEGSAGEAELEAEPVAEVELVEVEAEIIEEAAAEEDSTTIGELESLTEAEPLEQAEPAEPITADALEPVTPFDDESAGDSWDEFDVEQVSEVETELDEAK